MLVVVFYSVGKIGFSFLGILLRIIKQMIYIENMIKIKFLLTFIWWVLSKSLSLSIIKNEILCLTTLLR